MKKFVLLLAVSMLSAMSVAAVENSAAESKKELVGHWESKSINGDALFFIVSSIEGYMYADGRFKGTINYTDFQTGTQKGTYKVEGDHILLYTPDSKTPYKLLYKYDPVKDRLTVTDEAFDVSLTLRRGGKKQSEGGDWL